MKAKNMAMILGLVSGMAVLTPDCATAALKNGWEKVNNTWYFYEEGNKISGWRQIEGTWYYMDSDGAMKRGWLNDRGAWYYFNYSGNMATGWKEIRGTWYYFEESGKMHTGWLNDRGTWYYLNSDGSMAHDTVIDEYVINSNGAWVDTLNKNNTSDPNETTKKKNYTFTEGLNKFSADSASIILSQGEKDKNGVYSPVSFYMALSVLSEGADNDTKKDILNALNINDADKLSEECSNLYKKEIFKTDNGMCGIADSVWIDDNNNVKFNEETIKDIEKKYKADINKGDLQSRENAEKISSWLLEHTGGLLGGNPDSFIGEEDEVMKIFNAVYFKDKWQDVFDKGRTHENSFKLDNENTVQTDFMYKSFDTVINESEKGYKSSSLDFENGHKMIFILPDEGSSPYDIINNSDKLYEALNSLSSDKAEFHSVDYIVPKFKFKSKMDLNDCAKKMGLGSIFNPNADFSKFAQDGDLYVSGIIQEATVSIDEDGGEAAAYTEMMTAACAAEVNEKTYDMRLDRPFIFAIADKDNVPLFVGIINNPTLGNN